MYKTINIRWDESDSSDLAKLGIYTGDESYSFKEVEINLNKIVMIREYEGICLIAFSLLEEDMIITDIPWKNRDLLKI